MTLPKFKPSKQWLALERRVKEKSEQVRKEADDGTLPPAPQEN
jgi:hypothetical protein